MDRKEFKSRLFNKSIKPEDIDYWQKLFAEVLFRLKELEDLNCPCSFCFRDRLYNRNLVDRIVKECHIKYDPPPKNFTGTGDCGRKIGPAA